MPRRICHLATTSVGLHENCPVTDGGGSAPAAAVAGALDGGRLIQDRTASDYGNAPLLPPRFAGV